MSYKPQIVQTKSVYGGPKGTSKVVWNKDHSKLQVTIGTDKYVFSSKDVPFNKFPSGEYFVQLSEDKSKITAIRPNNGMFVVKTDRLVSKEGEEPAPKTMTANFEGKEYSYQAFGVMLKIVSPKEYEGMEIYLSLRYHFEGVEMEIKGQKVEVVAINHPKSKYTGILTDYLDAAGVWNKGPIKMATNVLPTIAKRVALEDKKFQVVQKDGWPTTIFSMPDLLEDEDTEPETELEPETETEFESDTPEVLDTSDDDELNWE